MDINYRKQNPLLSLEVAITSLVALVCMGLFIFVPTKGIFQEVVLTLISLLLIPILYIKIILKEKLINFGCQLPTWREGLFIIPISFFIISIFAWIVFRHTDFLVDYSLGGTVVAKSVWYFMLYEFLLVNFFVVVYEFFFRGFLMFYFVKKKDIWGVFIQWAVFMVFCGMSDKFSLDYIFYFISAILSGIIAYKSKSLVYSYFFSIIVLVIMDVIYLKLIK